MRQELPNLTGMVSIVTGAATGIGRVIATSLAEQGSAVVVAYKPGTDGIAVAQEITEKGGTATSLAADLTSKEDIDWLVHETLVHHGKITVLVNNAFAWTGKQWEDHTWEDIGDSTRIFDGIAYLTKLVLRHMRSMKIRGTGISITSVHELTVRRTHPLYSAMKAALSMLTKELAVEYGPYGIRVNAVAPGHIETRPDRVAEGARAPNPYIPLCFQSGLPEDIAKAVLFLASPLVSGFVTGQTLFVDGGERLFAEWVSRIPPGT